MICRGYCCAKKINRKPDASVADSHISVHRIGHQDHQSIELVGSVMNNET